MIKPNLVNIQNLLVIALSLPKTIFFNLYYFNIKVAIKLPVIVKYNVRLQSLKGTVMIENPTPGSIRIGFHNNRAYDNARERAVWHMENGQLTFCGKASLGNGTIIAVTGILMLGDNFAVSGNSKIICGSRTVIGKNVLIGYDCLLLDYDAHSIYDVNSNMRVNNKSGIVLGDNIWIGAYSKIITGTVIKDNTVIALGSLSCKEQIEENVLLAGQPASVVKRNVYFHH